MSHRDIPRQLPEGFGNPSDRRLGFATVTRYLEIAGKERRYELFVPTGHDTTKPSPLILAFHGAGSTPTQFAYVSQLNRRGGRMGYVIAYPAAAGSFWDASAKEGNNDIAFVRAMLQDITTAIPIDSDRIFATGMSNGGQMVYTLACEFSERIAAIAVCACGMRRGGCRPQRAVSVLHFHGTQDPLVPFLWGKDAVSQWIKLDRCEGVPTETYKNGAAGCLTYSDVATGTTVTMCTVDGMGHQWPGLAIRFSEKETELLELPSVLSRLGPGTDDLDATGMLLSFFAEHPIRRSADADESKT